MSRYGNAAAETDELASSPFSASRVWRVSALSAGAALVVGALLLATLGRDGPEGRDRSPARAGNANAASVATPSPTPSVDTAHSRLVAGLGDLAAVQRALALPHVELNEVRYSSPTDAVAWLYAYRSINSEPRTVVLVTDDNCATAAAITPQADNVEIKELPGGGALINLYQFEGDLRFLMSADGSVTPVRVLRGKHVPPRRAVLTDALEGARCRDVCVLDPVRAVIYEPKARVCRCRLWLGNLLFTGTDGAAHKTFAQQTQGSGMQVRVTSSRNSGRSWREQLVDVLGTDGEYAWAAAAGRRGQLAFIASHEVPSNRLKPRALYITDNGRTWRRIPAIKPLTAAGSLAFTPSGTLLVSATPHFRLLRIRLGAHQARRLRGSPRVYRIESSGGVVVGYRRDSFTLEVSRTGRTWRPVQPATATLRGVH